MDEHKLFVGNMAARITQRDLWRFFSAYGVIDECAKFHESYAFVRFVQTDDAQRARRETHGMMLKGRKLKVEFAATMDKTNTAPWNQQKYLQIQPLRRSTNLPEHNSQSAPSSITIADKIIPNGEEFHTPDLLRLAGIQSASSDDGYETNSSSIINNCYKSRFFPISIRRHNTYSDPISDPNDHQKENLNILSFDLTRIRLFSDVSSGFGDDSNLFSE